MKEEQGCWQGELGDSGDVSYTLGSGAGIVCHENKS